jgi:hypothetical protein
MSDDPTSDESEPASPTCFLSQAPDGFGFAKPLTEAEIAALLDAVRGLVQAGDIEQARRRLRESVPLIGDPTLRTAFAALVAAQTITLADIERLCR